MSDEAIGVGDPRFEQLYAVWIKEHKPGYVTLENGGMFRVLQLSDEVVKFLPMQGGVDGMYSSTSARAISGDRR